jgi:hypothetical protein
MKKKKGKKTNVIFNFLNAIHSARLAAILIREEWRMIISLGYIS